MQAESSCKLWMLLANCQAIPTLSHLSSWIHQYSRVHSCWRWRYLPPWKQREWQSVLNNTEIWEFESNRTVSSQNSHLPSSQYCYFDGFPIALKPFITFSFSLGSISFGYLPVRATETPASMSISRKTDYERWKRNANSNCSLKNIVHLKIQILKYMLFKTPHVV